MRCRSQLVHIGFRRSGLFTYRPYCDDCDACVSVRIPVARFVANRTQRRVWRRHAGRLFAPFAARLRFEMEHYALYRRYRPRATPTAAWPTTTTTNTPNSS